MKIIEMQIDGTLGKIRPVRPLQVNDFLKKRHGYVWYQDDISLAKHKLVGPFKFGTTVRKKLKHPSMVENKQ